MAHYRPIVNAPEGLGNILYMTSSLYEEDLVVNNDIEKFHSMLLLHGTCQFHIYNDGTISTKVITPEIEKVQDDFVFSFKIGTVKHKLSINRNDYAQTPFAVVGFFTVDATGFFEVRFE